MRDRRRDTLKGIAQHIKSTGNFPRAFTIDTTQTMSGNVSHINYVCKGKDVIFNVGDNESWPEIDEVLFAMMEKNIVGNT